MYRSRREQDKARAELNTHAERYFEIRRQFDEYLQQHPIQIPTDLLKEIEARKIELDSPDLTFERWKEIMDDSRESAARAKASEGPIEDKYRRLYFLRTAPGNNKREISELEDVLSECYCGSGKIFKECHGV